MGEKLEMGLQEARELLVSMGLKPAEGWPIKRLEVKLNRFVDLVNNGAKEPKDEEQKRVFDSVLEFVKDGGKISVIDSTESEEEDITVATATVEKKKGKKSKGSKAEDNGKPEKKKRKAPNADAPKDDWGSRLGSIRAKVNELIGKKPITHSQIAEKVGSTFFRKHIKSLLDKKFIKKVADGYVRA